jgi:eukaryotic-like serine/threonine-protein kinase
VPADGSKVDDTKFRKPQKTMVQRNGGERGIRTPDTRKGIHAFEARAFSHSAISPRPSAYFYFIREAAGSGSEEILLEGGDQVRYVNDWSQDGKFLAYREPIKGIIAVWMLPMSGERKPYPFLQSQFAQLSGRFSPDTKWVAYCSNESGEFKVYVVPFPGPGGKWQVSAGSGCNPRWRRDGKELFYVSFDNKLIAADVRANGSSFEVGTLHTLFEARPASGLSSFDAAGDGQRFLFAYELGQPDAAITLVVNWTADVKK